LPQKQDLISIEGSPQKRDTERDAMHGHSDTPAATLSAALSASGFVGTWNHDLQTGNIILDSGAAEILLGDQNLGGKPITLDRTLISVHPDDRSWVKPEIEEFARSGGSFSAEYRIQLSSGKTRRILDLGHSSQQADGLKHGCGVLVDITDRPLHIARLNSDDTLATDRSLLTALADLENRALGTASFRTRVFLQMLRLEICHTDIQ
jgi:hypothetical protein